MKQDDAMTEAFEKRVPVTQPYLPPMEEVLESLKEIWNSKWLTNEGEFHKEFERALAEYLGVEYISLFTNGTIALVTALQALRITGEVITTPYSFVATSHALHWNGITPVFCDIEQDTFNLNPERIESAITPKTTAIMPVHTYGNPCAHNRIKKTADQYGLKVIYDSAHSFGVRMENRSLCDFGDLAILSFHATKVFTTFEGGAIVSHDDAMRRRINFLKNFGFADEVTVVAPGINGKMNEFQAAIGLLQLKYVEDAIAKRKAIAECYRQELEEINGLRLMPDIAGVQANYGYFPVLIDEAEFGRSRDSLYQELCKHNIWGRRYFFPLISHFPMYRGLNSANSSNLPIAESISRRILCLPIYPDLSFDDVERVVCVIRKCAVRRG